MQEITTAPEYAGTKDTFKTLVCKSITKHFMSEEISELQKIVSLPYNTALASGLRQRKHFKVICILNHHKASHQLRNFRIAKDCIFPYSTASASGFGPRTILK